MSIVSLLEQIRNDEIVLPAIQRDFVWSEEKIEKLLDSIMRGYPIGIILLWETFNDIQYRYFVRDYRQDNQHTFHNNSQHKRLKLVLDGQQRLQSLYIALFGAYEGRYLYFDVLSGRETQDFKEDKFIFHLFTPEDSDERNKQAGYQNVRGKKDEEYEPSYYYKVQDIMVMGAREEQKFQRDIGEELELSDEDKLRLSLNLSILRNVLTNDGNILKATVLDENKPRENADRKSESDVLEAFVRINREGTPLSRSDLIFSMLKLKWGESAETLPEFVDSVNEGNSFQLDTDFVIRCLFAVSELGTKFDVDVLRKPPNVEKLKKNFQGCCDAIRSTVDFVRDECWIASSRLLRGYYNLVPIVYYLFHTRNHQVPNSQIDRVRKSVYLLGFTSPFSRYADSRLAKFIGQELKPLAEAHSDRFPLEECLWWVWYWERIEDYGPQLLQRNPSLALHLLQHRSGAKVQYDRNAPHIDHIFPRSKLKNEKYGEVDINHFANLWILAARKNENKSSRHPREYFKDVSDHQLRRAYIDRELLDYKHYKRFLRQREAKILEHVKAVLGLSDSDFKVSAHWVID